MPVLSEYQMILTSVFGMHRDNFVPAAENRPIAILRFLNLPPLPAENIRMNNLTGNFRRACKRLIHFTIASGCWRRAAIFAAIFATAIGAGLPARAADTGSSTASLVNTILGVRYGFGFSQAEISDSQNALVTRYKNPAAIWQEASVLYPVGLRLGLREVFDQNAGVMFNGGAEQRAEIYLTQIEIGPIFYLPVPFIQPWASFGLVGGTMAVTNPVTRSFDNWAAAFSNETSGIRGTYFAGGIDILFHEKFGIRLGYQQDRIETNDYYNLNQTQMKFVLQRYSIGLVGRP